MRILFCVGCSKFKWHYLVKMAKWCCKSWHCHFIHDFQMNSKLFNIDLVLLYDRLLITFLKMPVGFRFSVNGWKHFNGIASRNFGDFEKSIEIHWQQVHLPLSNSCSNVVVFFHAINYRHDFYFTSQIAPMMIVTSFNTKIYYNILELMVFYI